MMKWSNFELTTPKALTAGLLFNFIGLLGQYVNAAHTLSTNSSTSCEPCPDVCCPDGTCETITNEREGGSDKVCSGGTDMGIIIAIAVVGGVALIGGITYCAYNYWHKKTSNINNALHTLEEPLDDGFVANRAANSV